MPFKSRAGRFSHQTSHNSQPRNNKQKHIRQQEKPILRHRVPKTATPTASTTTAAAGGLIIVSNNFVSILALIESVFVGLILALTFLGFPSWPKIAWAKFTGKQYVIRLTKDNVLLFEGAKEVEGAYRTKTGVYEMEPEDTFTFNGTMAGLWYSPYNRAIQARVMPLLRKIREMGIETYSELKYYSETPIETIQTEAGEKAAEFAEWLQAQDGRILQDLEIVRIRDVKNFLESRSPAIENGIIERDVDIIRRKMNNPLSNTNFIMFIIMAGLLGLCFGYILAGGGGYEAPAAVGIASDAANHMTQIS